MNRVPSGVVLLGMDQADAVPAGHVVLARTSQALLVVYLLALAACSLAVAAGRIRLSPLGAAWLAIPVLAFGQAVRTGVRARRAADPAQRFQLFQKSTVETVLSAVFVASLAVTWVQEPESYSVW